MTFVDDVIGESKNAVDSACWYGHSFGELGLLEEERTI